MPLVRLSSRLMRSDGGLVSLRLLYHMLYPALVLDIRSPTSKHQRISVLPTRLTSEKTYLDVPSNKSNLNMSPVTSQLPISKNIFHTVFALD